MQSWQNRIIGLEYHKPGDIVEHPYQWRTHTEAQVAAIKGILAEVGIAGALLAYHSPENDGALTAIDGHLRKSLEAGIEWPVLVLDVNDAEALKLLATFDPIGAMARVDLEALQKVLERVETEDTALQAMLEGLAEDAGIDLGGDVTGEPDDVQIDKAVELQQKWQVRRGDVWEIASSTMQGKRHRVMCADNTDGDAIQAVLAGGTVAMLFIDPPYGIKLDTDYSWQPEGFYGRKLRQRQYAPVSGDENAFDARPVLKRFAHVDEVFLWGADNYANTLPDSGVGGTWYVWDKRVDETGEGFDKMFGGPFELCWGKKKRGREFIRMRWAGVFHGKNTGGETPYGDGRVHPTQKPASLARWFIEKFTVKGELVFDCFLGAGWTLVAAEKAGRIGIGMEILPRYVSATLERMAALTGRTPIRVIAGGT